MMEIRLTDEMAEDKLFAIVPISLAKISRNGLVTAASLG